MTSSTHHASALQAPANSAGIATPGSRWSDTLLRAAKVLSRTADRLGRHRAAAELLRRAGEYEATQPGFADELRQAARFLIEQRG